MTPSEDELVGYLSTLSNWGRWGDDDELGTLNLVTAERRVAAAALVRTGQTVSCGRMLAPGGEGSPTLHFMMSAGDDWPAEGFGGATDWFATAMHGLSVTHLDAHSHIFWDGLMYNGRPAARVSGTKGARSGSVHVAATGWVARGVLADIPRHRGVDRLDARDTISPEEVRDCLRACGSDVRPGDVLLIRTGRDVDGPPYGHERPGLHARALPWLREQDISLLASDCTQEVNPSGYQAMPFPVHTVGIRAMGLWLLDNAWLEDLADLCRATNRWAFCFVVAPLRIKNATGSPVNPMAIF